MKLMVLPLTTRISTISSYNPLKTITKRLTCHIITAVIATSGTLAATGIGTGPGAAGAVVVTGSEVLVLGGALVTMNAAKVVNKRIPRVFQPTKCPLRLDI